MTLSQTQDVWFREWTRRRNERVIKIAEGFTRIDRGDQTAVAVVRFLQRARHWCEAAWRFRCRLPPSTRLEVLTERRNILTTYHRHARLPQGLLPADPECVYFVYFAADFYYLDPASIYGVNYAPAPDAPARSQLFDVGGVYPCDPAVDAVAPPGTLFADHPVLAAVPAGVLMDGQDQAVHTAVLSSNLDQEAQERSWAAAATRRNYRRIGTGVIPYKLPDDDEITGYEAQSPPKPVD